MIDEHHTYTFRESTAYSYSELKVFALSLAVFGSITAGFALQVVDLEILSTKVFIWCMFYPAIIFILYRIHKKLFPRRIDINTQGIQFKNFSFRTPKSILWGEIEKIKHIKIHVNYLLKREYIILETVNHRKVFIAINDEGCDLFLDASFTGLTLLKVLQLFNLTLKGHDIEEHVNKFYDYFNQAISKKEKLILYFGFAILVLVFVAAVKSLSLQSIIKPSWLSYFLIFIVSFILAKIFTNEVKRSINIVIVALVFGAMNCVSLKLLYGALPGYFGESSEYTFAITKDIPKHQIWSMEASPELTFVMVHGAKVRRYQGIGTTETFKIYEGPLWLKALSREADRMLDKGMGNNNRNSKAGN